MEFVLARQKTVTTFIKANTAQIFNCFFAHVLHPPFTLLSFVFIFLFCYLLLLLFEEKSQTAEDQNEEENNSNDGTDNDNRES